MVNRFAACFLVFSFIMVTGTNKASSSGEDGTEEIEKSEEKNTNQKSSSEPLKTTSNSFKIKEAEEELLRQEDLNKDLGDLRRSLNMPEELSYLPKKDVEPAAKPQVLKSFRISPSTDDVPSSENLSPRRPKLSNAGSMFQSLQDHAVQSSNEGPPPDWVVAAAMQKAEQGS